MTNSGPESNASGVSKFFGTSPISTGTMHSITGVYRSVSNATFSTKRNQKMKKQAVKA